VIDMVGVEHRHPRTGAEDMESNATTATHSRKLDDRRTHRPGLYEH
jgi:hypothetical protein